MLKTKNLKTSNLFLTLIPLVILTTLTSIAEVLLYLLFGLTIDQLALAIKQPDSKSVWNLEPIGAFILLSVVQILIGILLLIIFFPLKSFLLQKTSCSYLMKIRKRFFGKVSSLSYLESYSQLTKPQIVSLILNDSTAYADGMINHHIDLLSSITAIIFALFSLYLYHWSLALLIFMALILSSLISYFFDNKVKKVNQEFSDANSKLTKNVVQLLSSYEPIFLLGKENYFKKQVSIALSDRFKAMSRQLRLQQRLSLTLGWTSNALLYLVSFGAILLAASLPESVINLGASLATFAIFGSLNARFNSIFSTLLSLRGLKIYREKLDLKTGNLQEKTKNILNIEDHKPRVFTPKSLEFDSIEMDNLSLNIEGKQVLKNLKLTFKAGKKYAIVGPSGIGKSSLIKIIAGLINNYSGKIKLNGIDYNCLPDRFLTHFISLNEGDNILFEGTIAENISLWQGEDVEEALEFANLNLETLGLTKHSPALDLSEGERQRIAIARSYYESKPIIILDESLANLDKENRRYIKKRLSQLEATVILVSHHIDKNDKFFDQIIDLNAFSKSIK